MPISIGPTVSFTRKFATGTNTTSNAGEVVASITASAGKKLVGIQYVGTGGTSPQYEVTITHTDDTTETSGAHATRIAGGRAGFTGSASGFIFTANKDVKKVEVKLGAGTGAGTKTASVSAEEVSQ